MRKIACRGVAVENMGRVVGGGIKTKNADNVRVFGGGGGGSEIPENADILGFFFPGNFFSLPGLYTILTKIYKNSSISAN